MFQVEFRDGRFLKVKTAWENIVNFATVKKAEYVWDLSEDGTPKTLLWRRDRKNDYDVLQIDMMSYDKENSKYSESVVRYSDIPYTMQGLRQKSLKLLEKGYEHVVYAVMYYEEELLQKCRTVLLPLSDIEYQRFKNKVSNNGVIFAVHQSDISRYAC